MSKVCFFWTGQREREQAWGAAAAMHLSDALPASVKTWIQRFFSIDLNIFLQLCHQNPNHRRLCEDLGISAEAIALRLLQQGAPQEEAFREIASAGAAYQKAFVLTSLEQYEKRAAEMQKILSQQGQATGDRN